MLVCGDHDPTFRGLATTSLFPSLLPSSSIFFTSGSLNTLSYPPYQAVDEMNGKLVNSRPIYCGRAQKKKERIVELQRRYEAERIERYSR